MVRNRDNIAGPDHQTGGRQNIGLIAVVAGRDINLPVHIFVPKPQFGGAIVMDTDANYGTCPLPKTRLAS